MYLSCFFLFKSLIGNGKGGKNKSTKMIIYVLNVRPGIESKWQQLTVSKKILLDDMFETCALYNNENLLFYDSGNV